MTTRVADGSVWAVRARSDAAAGGPIAVVALADPKLVRRLTEGAGVQVLTSALIGALLLVAADLLSMVLPSRLTMPVGLVTGVIGGVYLLWVLSAKENV